jgi:hypothetical protein
MSPKQDWVVRLSNIVFNGSTLTQSRFIDSVKQYSTNNAYAIVTNLTNLSANIMRADDQVDGFAISNNVLVLDSWATAIEGELKVSIVSSTNTARTMFELIQFNIERSVAND